MAFAAAIATAQNNRHGRRGPPPPLASHMRHIGPYGLPHPTNLAKLKEVKRNSGRSALTTLASCACVGFTVAGVSLLVDSLTDERGMLVQEYNEEVTGWTSKVREEFASISIEATATYTPAVSSTALATPEAPLTEPVVRTLSLQAVSSEEEGLQDVENGEGLNEYKALFYRSTLRLPNYYAGYSANSKGNPLLASNTPADLLPEEAAASQVQVAFRITARDGSVYNLSLRSIPVAFDKTVIARTPAPDKKCKQEQHGLWVSHHCHVAKRLDELCIQLTQSQAGGWSFKDGVKGSPAGCHSSEDWSPAEYSVDPCWNRAGRSEPCEDAAESEHEVEVVIRSGEDPIIYASRLVGPSLSFGWSKNSQRSFGAIFLSLGLCFGFVPLCHLLDECAKKRRRRQNDSDEDGERRNLRFSNGADDTWNVSMESSELPTSPTGVLMGRSPAQGLEEEDGRPQGRSKQGWPVGQEV